MDDKPFPQSAIERYIPVQIAGRGADGIVYICVPSESRETAAPTPPEDFVHLHSRIVAVKALTDKEDHTINLNRLKRIRTAQAASSEGEKQLLPALLELHPDGPLPWYTMSVVQGRNLCELTSISKFPPHLVFHVFIEVMDALQFLAGSGLLHYDIQNDENVMLEIESAHQRVPGLPNVVVVDLDCLQEYTETSESATAKQLLELIARVIEGIEDDDICLPGSSDAKDVDDVKEFYEHARSLHLETLTLDALYTMWVGFAIRIREQERSSRLPERIEEALRSAVLTADDLMRRLDVDIVN